MKDSPVLVASLAAACLLSGCLSSRPVPGSPGAPPSATEGLGSLTVASATLGDVTFSPSSCAGGDRQFFLGADFADPSHSLVLRLVVDPIEGPAIRLFNSEAEFDKSVAFRRSECSVFHFSLDTTGWRVNDVYDYRITVEVDCSRPGESISGSVSSTHCH
ncbi:MAG: hypothetical protein ACHQQS_13085 [Thermoanaerobaculales bacterium]